MFSYVRELFRSGCRIALPISNLWIKSNFNVKTSLLTDVVVGNESFQLFGMQQVRTNVRNHFPRPSEHKRVTRHGYKTRMSTPAGRRIIMRRILKGRHVLSH